MTRCDHDLGESNAECHVAPGKAAALKGPGDARPGRFHKSLVPVDPDDEAALATCSLNL